MSTSQTLPKPEPVNLDLNLIFRQLANPQKWNTIQYLYSARFATASVIQRQCNLRQPTVSRYLSSLCEAGLTTKTKVSASTLYEINPETFAQLTALLGVMAK
jgi:predicted transcriptional regulator